MRDVRCIDLFCGVGGLTHGFVLEGLPVAAGIDFDPNCRYAYEANNSAAFIERDVALVKSQELSALFGDSKYRVLAGCAPCQPFSTYSQRYEPEGPGGKWSLLYQFGRLVKELQPEIVTMENVPTVARHRVFADFQAQLTGLGYSVWSAVVDSSQYGVPQTRKRMVLLASRLGEIKLISPTCSQPKTVKQAIGRLRQLGAGESSAHDRLHASAALTKKNVERIKASKPGGTWRDWPRRLINECHKADTGRTYPAVYGRMEWDKPAPTMTTQCFGFGNGRFGHPDQDRAISLREAAILQSFPKNYLFVRKDDPVHFTTMGRLIGNAVPVDLGRAIAKSIKLHLMSL